MDADEDVESAPILTPRKEGQQPIPAVTISSERLCSCTLLSAVRQPQSYSARSLTQANMDYHV